MTFKELGLSAPILKAIESQGYETPSPIQAKSIPAVLEGRDVMAAAQTGTGKTHTAHRMQHIYRALNQDVEYGFEPTPIKPRDFPALTSAQRLHLEVNGYVVIGTSRVLSRPRLALAMSQNS